MLGNEEDLTRNFNALNPFIDDKGIIRIKGRLTKFHPLISKKKIPTNLPNDLN